MATGDRVKRLLTNVRSVLGDEGELKQQASPKAILDSLNRVQRRIAEEAMCLEESTEISVDSGTELYAFPDGMIHERMLIPDGAIQLKQIAFEEVDRIKRSAQADDSVTDTTADELYYYYKWSGQFGFLLSDGTSPDSGSIVTVYYWRYPSTSEEMTETRDPILDNVWDSCLFYGSVAELTGEPKWWALFEKEIGRRSSKERAIRSASGRVPNNQDYD
jgi:hypothetical protein